MKKKLTKMKKKEEKVKQWKAKKKNEIKNIRWKNEEENGKKILYSLCHLEFFSWTILYGKDNICTSFQQVFDFYWANNFVVKSFEAMGTLMDLLSETQNVNTIRIIKLHRFRIDWLLISIFALKYSDYNFHT